MNSNSYGMNQTFQHTSFIHSSKLFFVLNLAWENLIHPSSILYHLYLASKSLIRSSELVHFKLSSLIHT